MLGPRQNAVLSPQLNKRELFHGIEKNRPGPVLCALMPLSANAADKLMMATTTSTQDTGLLEYLSHISKRIRASTWPGSLVGTGKALELAKNCDADVLLVHAPAAEKKFVEAGYGIDRRQIMYNDFVLTGPKDDPAKVAGKGIAEAQQISERPPLCEPRR